MTADPGKRHPYPGRLIAVEGLDGSGKSTQIYLIKKWLEGQGIRVFFSKWNSSILVKSATSKGKNRALLTPTTFSLIHATDFADRYERQLVPLLRAGYIVLCDRYIYTAFARDLFAVGGPGPWLRCDDSSVAEVPADDVRSSAAYVLFYARRDAVRAESLSSPPDSNV